MGSKAEWLYRVLESGAEGPGFKSQPRRSRVTILGKLCVEKCRSAVSAA